MSVEETPLSVQRTQWFALSIVLLIIVGVSSWQASAYVGENQRIREENVTLKAQNVELNKELSKLQDRVQPGTPGWRPGNPIGGIPTGALPDK